MSYSTLKCRDYFRTVLEETLRQRGYSINVMFCKSIIKSCLLIYYEEDKIDILTEGDMLFDYIYELYTKLVLTLSGHYCGIHDTHIEEEISYDDDRNYKEECIRDKLAELESKYDFIITYSGRDYMQPVLFYEEIYDCKLDKLQPLFMDVINDIYEKYKELMETSSLLEPSLETFSCYITIDKKEDVIKCILYCLERQYDIPPELTLLILSFIGVKRISLFEKYFELLDVEDEYISSLIV